MGLPVSGKQFQSNGGKKAIMTHDMWNEVFYENYTWESRMEGSTRMFGKTSTSKFLVYRSDLMPANGAVSHLILSLVQLISSLPIFSCFCFETASECMSGMRLFVSSIPLLLPWGVIFLLFTVAMESGQ